ncbi:MAG: S-adenosyl-l-methionine hydroxide adenosyltransferase family protein [Methylophilaceae bacterium]|uniref:SAM hydrolase/SAM-dependent halogenase family protein n=1 Tax=Methylobacillus sp. MM3 TaxID=1848039 RepID=UPI000A8958EB|nr:SAM-dependent chlorinase/fluorinase [Methylobacillus sp. MM3]
MTGFFVFWEAIVILLFTDFGSSDIYVGQVKAKLTSLVPTACVIDLLHDVPNFDACAGAYLLAALHESLPLNSVTMAVVDPGVGSARQPVVVEADGRWYVGPDNGLLSVVAGRAETARVWRINWLNPHVSDSFHGRDIFAPVAAMLERQEWSPEVLNPIECLDVILDTHGVEKVIYIDHYGNAMTGISGKNINDAAVLNLEDQSFRYARVFSEVPAGDAFWYRNSIGLVEIAMNCRSAARALNITVGDAVRWS